MASVVFDPAAFIARYPEFALVSPLLLGDYFVEATLYCNNTDLSVVADIPTRTLFLNMLTAHIAKLAAAPLVGRIDSAAEGSVSAHTVYSNAVAGSMAWYIQTQYGASYWTASKPYRSFRYVPQQPTRVY